MDAIITASTRAVALWLPEVAASSNVIPTTSRVFYRYLPIRRQSGRDPDRLHSVRMARHSGLKARDELNIAEVKIRL